MDDGTNLVVGSEAWIAYIFATPPARNLKGRSLHKQRHLIFEPHLTRFARLESRGEIAGFLALAYLRTLGRISAFKEQPITLKLDNWEEEHTPDLAFRLSDKRFYFVEMKYERFLSREERARFAERAADLQKFGVGYLLWTDKTPLTLALKHNLYEMRRCVGMRFELAELSTITEFVRTRAQVSFSDLSAANFHEDLVHHALAKGKIYANALNRFLPSTMFSASDDKPLLPTLLSAKPTIRSYWDSLDVA